MDWAKALLGRLTMRSPSSSSYPPPVFAVDRTEVAVAATAGTGVPVPELTLRELNKATRSFSAASLIGGGMHTAVYRATLPIRNGNGNGNGGKAIAAVAKKIERLPSGLSWSASDDEFLRRQVLVLSRLRHDNVVRLLGYTIDPAAGVRALLFEFADMGTLHDALHGGRPAAGPGPGSSSRPRPALSWAQRAGIALDVARGLEYLHDAAAVSHQSLSSTKVLLFQQAGFSSFRAKIADYDLFMQRPRDEGWAPNVMMITSHYPPEYAMTGSTCNSPKFDVYSYGALLLELLTGRKRNGAAPPVLREGRVEELMDPKLGTQYPPSQALKLARMALCCLQENPESRPSMADVAQTISCHIVSSSETSMAK